MPRGSEAPCLTQEASPITEVGRTSEVEPITEVELITEVARIPQAGTIRARAPADRGPGRQRPWCSSAAGTSPEARGPRPAHTTTTIIPMLITTTTIATTTAATTTTASGGRGDVHAPEGGVINAFSAPPVTSLWRRG